MSGEGYHTDEKIKNEEYLELLNEAFCEMYRHTLPEWLPIGRRIRFYRHLELKHALEGEEYDDE